MNRPRVAARTGPGMISEDQLQETLVAACRATRRRVFHAGDSRKQVRTKQGYELVGDELATGYPDLTVAPRREDGLAIWAELKGPEGRLEEGQVEWLDDLPHHQAFVWESRDLDEALEIIQRGHPAGVCRTCWACSREEIIERIHIRKKRGAAGRTVRTQKMEATTGPKGGRK